MQEVDEVTQRMVVLCAIFKSIKGGAMAETDMKKLGTSEEKMFGPRGIIAYGFKVKERAILLKVIKRSFRDIPHTLFPTDDKLSCTLEEILSLDNRSGQQEKSSIRRAVIVSGVQESELHRLLAQYKKSSLDAPFWATMTPTSYKWSLEELLTELNRERLAMQQCEV